MSMSEEDKLEIRKIVRLELKSFLEELSEAASREDGYETGELKSSALGAIRDTVERLAFTYPHFKTCRKWKYSWDSCTCGVGDE